MMHESRIKEYESKGYCKNGIKAFFKAMQIAFYVDDDLDKSSETICMKAFNEFLKSPDKSFHYAMKSFGIAFADNGKCFQNLCYKWVKYLNDEEMFFEGETLCDLKSGESIYSFCLRVCKEIGGEHIPPGLPDCWKMFPDGRGFVDVEIVEVFYTHRIPNIKLNNYGWWCDYIYGALRCDLLLVEDDIKAGCRIKHSPFQAISAWLYSGGDKNKFTELYLPSTRTLREAA